MYLLSAFAPVILAAMTAPECGGGSEETLPLPGFEPGRTGLPHVFSFQWLSISPGRLAKRLGVPWLVQVAAMTLPPP